MSDVNDNRPAEDGSDSDFTDTYPEDWPEGKRKFKPGTHRLTRFKRGESYADYTKRRRKEIKKRYDEKRKESRAALKTAGERAFKVAKGGWTACDDDPFITLVVGQSNFEEDNPVERYRKCGNAIKLRLSVDQAARKKHVEKRNAVYEDIPEWWIGFHVDPERNVGEPGTVVREKDVRQLPLLPWFRVKESTIAGAGLGLFADRDFQKDQIVGMYLGGKTGMPDYTIKPRWKNAELIHCYSFASAEAFNEHSARTMGLQMCNDPNYGMPNNSQKSPLWNVAFMGDMFALATKDIKKGEEMFADYRMTDEDDNSAEDNSKDESSYDEDNDNDNDK